MPGIIAARRAAAPLLDQVTHFQVRSDTVIVTKEGDPVEVDWTGEGVTKPVATGTVGQAISTAHKLAGVTFVSDELLADSNGNAEQLVSRQFAQATDAKIDAAIIAGSGIGQPLGVLHAPDVASVPVDDQDAAALVDSVTKAISRLATRFYPPNLVVLHPALAVRFIKLGVEVPPIPSLGPLIELVEKLRRPQLVAGRRPRIIEDLLKQRPPPINIHSRAPPAQPESAGHAPRPARRSSSQPRTPTETAPSTSARTRRRRPRGRSLGRSRSAARRGGGGGAASGRR